MYHKIHKGQGAVWIILIIAIVALITLWVSKNPSSISSTPEPTPEITTQPTNEIKQNSAPPKSLQDIENELDDLNTSAKDIDKGLNDTQLDITE